MKKILIALSSTLLFSQVASADFCGGGKIIAFIEGQNGSDNLAIKVDYSAHTDRHPGTTHGGWIIYPKDAMSSSRFEGIKTLALTAYYTGEIVWTYSHEDRCDRTTELGIGSL